MKPIRNVCDSHPEPMWLSPFIGVRFPAVVHVWIGRGSELNASSGGTDADRVRSSCGCPDPESDRASECGKPVAGLWLPDPAGEPHAIHTEFLVGSLKQHD